MKITHALLFGSLFLVACGGSDRGDDNTITPARDGGMTVDQRDGGEVVTDRDGGMTVDPNVIEAPFDTWTWVDVPDSRCMNDTPTGFAVNIHEGSDKLLIYMMGGNACFNAGSCATTYNLDGYGSAKFEADAIGITNFPLFGRNAPQNHFNDYSYVMIPYCSGDVYSGTIGATTVQGASYKFQGFTNVGLFLERIVPTFASANTVVLSGFSAGGFGALLNFDRTQKAFGSNAEVTLIDDSGPPMSSQFLAPCLQNHWVTTWGMDQGPIAACTNCIQQDGSFVEQYLAYLKTTYPTNRFGVIASNADGVIRQFYGYGLANCANLNGFPGNYTGALFQMGLEDYRDNLIGDVDNFKLYMPTSQRHVWSDGVMWTTSHFGVTMQDWIVDAINDEPSWDNVP